VRGCVRACLSGPPFADAKAVAVLFVVVSFWWNVKFWPEAAVDDLIAKSREGPGLDCLWDKLHVIPS
jgi:hypothetical protein